MSHQGTYLINFLGESILCERAYYFIDNWSNCFTSNQSKIWRLSTLELDFILWACMHIEPTSLNFREICLINKASKLGSVKGLMFKPPLHKFCFPHFNLLDMNLNSSPICSSLDKNLKSCHPSTHEHGDICEGGC